MEGLHRVSSRKRASVIRDLLFRSSRHRQIPDSLRGFQDDKSLRLFVAAAATLCSTSILAAELPIEGVFGDELGCARLTMDLNDIDEPGGVNVYADRLRGYEWGCTWAEVWPYPVRGGYGVQGLCSGEGIPSLEQFIIDFNRDGATPRMTVSGPDGSQRWVLDVCEGVPEQGGKG